MSYKDGESDEFMFENEITSQLLKEKGKNSDGTFFFPNLMENQRKQQLQSHSTTAVSDAVHTHPDYKLSFCVKSISAKLCWNG